MATLKDVFTARAVAAYFNRYNETIALPPYLGRSFFGTQKKIGLDLSWIKGSKSMPVALKGAAFDANAPIRDSIGFTKIDNEMPFFREAYKVTEKEQQDYDTFINASNTALANQVLQEIIKKPIDLINAADIVPERMIWQLLAPTDGIPRIAVTVADGSSYYIDYTGDNGVAYKAKNYTAITGSTDVWSASATATPIADLVDFTENYESNYGVKLGTIIMNQATWKNLVKAEDTKLQVLGSVAYSAGVAIKDREVKEFLLSNYGLEVLVYNKMYSDGTNTSTFIPDGIVTGIATGATTLGSVFYGTTPEERSGDITKGNLALVNTGVSVYTYTEEHPIISNCVVSEIVLPSYEGMDNVAVLNTEAA